LIHSPCLKNISPILYFTMFKRYFMAPKFYKIFVGWCWKFIKNIGRWCHFYMKKMKEYENEVRKSTLRIIKKKPSSRRAISNGAKMSFMNFITLFMASIHLKRLQYSNLVLYFSFLSWIF
jgi:hypothetical protein